jgi:hypothetical protein
MNLTHKPKSPEETVSGILKHPGAVQQMLNVAHALSVQRRRELIVDLLENNQINSDEALTMLDSTGKPAVIREQDMSNGPDSPERRLVTLRFKLNPSTPEHE